MRKGIVVVAIICGVFLAFSQLVLPTLVERTLAHRIQESLQAQEVEVHISTLPGFMLLAGQMDTVEVKVHQAMVGQVAVSELTMSGQNVRGDFSALDSKDGSAIQSADSLTMTGVITQQALQDLLVQKIDRIDNIQTTMDKEKLSASGQIKLGGRTADIHLTGTVFAENGSAYFHMTQLDIKNSLFGRAVLGNFFGDILLFDMYNMPIRLEIDDIEHADGQVLIRASRHSGQDEGWLK